MRLEHELVDANRVCPGIQKVRVGPATRSAVATHDIVNPSGSAYSFSNKQSCTMWVGLHKRVNYGTVDCVYKWL